MTNALKKDATYTALPAVVARLWPALALSLCACACASSSPDAAQSMTPREVNTNDAQFDGQEVVVRGYLVLGSQGRSLYQSKQRFREFGRALYANRPDFDPADYDADCLTLLNADPLLDNRETLAGRTVTLRGVFEKNYLDGTMVDLQACGGPTALALDTDDVARLVRSLVKN